MNQVLDHVIALTNLYGLVHKDKVLEVYNLQNDAVDISVIEKIMQDNPILLAASHIEIYGDYFVAEAIMGFDEFDDQLAQRAGKPWYIPKKEELFKYRDRHYYEVTKEFKALYDYVSQKHFGGSTEKAKEFCEELVDLCQVGISMEAIVDTIEYFGINLNNKSEINKLMKRIIPMTNNVRLWVNNGHTPLEISQLFDKPRLKPVPRPFENNLVTGRVGKKVGRNESCPCGSGKKYKKCCLGKE